MVGLAFALGLLVLLILIGLAFMWQGTIRLPGAPVAYGVEESIRYIAPRLSEDIRAKVGSKSVRRILEWEMNYLHERLDAGSGEPVVLGGEEAIGYVLQQTARQGYEYDRETVAEVMRLQAEYMESIGALDRPVGKDEMKTLGFDDG
jgi:hypothetical protein